MTIKEDDNIEDEKLVRVQQQLYQGQETETYGGGGRLDPPFLAGGGG